MPPAIALIIAVLGFGSPFVVVALAVCERRRRRRAEAFAALWVVQADSVGVVLVVLVLSRRR